LSALTLYPQLSQCRRGARGTPSQDPALRGSFLAPPRNPAAMAVEGAKPDI